MNYIIFKTKQKKIILQNGINNAIMKNYHWSLLNAIIMKDYIINMYITIPQSICLHYVCFYEKPSVKIVFRIFQCLKVQKNDSNEKKKKKSMTYF